MEIDTFFVKGIKVCLCSSKKFNTTTIGLALRTTLNADVVSANALIPRLLSRASSKYPTLRSLNRALELTGGAEMVAQPIKKGDEQILTFYLRAPHSYTGRLFELVGELVYKPLLRDNGFMPSYVHNACSVAAREIKEKINNKRGYASERLIELMCEGEPFGISTDGYIEDFGGINGQGLYSAYKTLLAECVTELYIVGNIGRGEAESYVANHFDYVALRKPKNTDFIVKEKQPIRLHEIETDIAQAVLTLGIRTNCKSYPELLVANEILGGSATSRLFRTVREKLGMCYYIGSQLYRYKGIIAVQAGIDEKNTTSVVDAVCSEQELMSHKTVDKAEIKAAIDGIKARLATAEDYPQRLIDLLLSFSVAGEPYSVQSLIDAVLGVESIKEVFENAFVDTVLLMK